MAIRWTSEDYNQLKAAIGQGVTRVKYTDKEVEYRSLNDMIKLLTMMEKDLGITQTSGVRLYAKHSKGLR